MWSWHCEPHIVIIALASFSITSWLTAGISNSFLANNFESKQVELRDQYYLSGCDIIHLHNSERSDWKRELLHEHHQRHRSRVGACVRASGRLQLCTQSRLGSFWGRWARQGGSPCRVGLGVIVWQGELYQYWHQQSLWVPCSIDELIGLPLQKRDDGPGFLERIACSGALQKRKKEDSAWPQWSHIKFVWLHRDLICWPWRHVWFSGLLVLCNHTFTVNKQIRLFILYINKLFMAISNWT